MSYAPARFSVDSSARSLRSLGRNDTGERLRLSLGRNDMGISSVVPLKVRHSALVSSRASEASRGIYGMSYAPARFSVDSSARSLRSLGRNDRIWVAPLAGDDRQKRIFTRAG